MSKFPRFESGVGDALKKAGLSVSETSEYTLEDIYTVVKGFCVLNEVECDKCAKYYPGIGSYCKQTLKRIIPEPLLFDSKFKQAAVQELEKLHYLPPEKIAEAALFPEAWFLKILKSRRLKEMHAKIYQTAMEKVGKHLKRLPELEDF